MTNRLWKNWFLLVTGVFLMVLPFLGFPRGGKDALSTFSGFVVVCLSFMLARENRNEDLSR